MLLSARMLIDVGSVNSFEVDDQVFWTEGDTLDVYFQLTDASLDTSIKGFHPSGRRYTPAAGATLQVVLENLDDAKKVTKTASQPFPGDLSIWKISISASDKARGSPQMRLTLTQSGVVTTGLVKNAVKIYPATNG